MKGGENEKMYNVNNVAVEKPVYGKKEELGMKDKSNQDFQKILKDTIKGTEKNVPRQTNKDEVKDLSKAGQEKKEWETSENTENQWNNLNLQENKSQPVQVLTDLLATKNTNTDALSLMQGQLADALLQKGAQIVVAPGTQDGQMNLNAQASTVQAKPAAQVGGIMQANIALATGQTLNVEQATLATEQASKMIAMVATNADDEKGSLLTSKEKELQKSTLAMDPLQNQADKVENKAEKSVVVKEASVQGAKANQSLASANIEVVTEKTIRQTDPSEAKIPEELTITVKPQTIDLDKVNIKVANVANMKETSLPDQVAEKIIFNVKNGKQEFDMQLYPKELGKIGVKIVIENGSAQVLLSCSNAKTQSLLAQNAEGLRGIVEGNLGMNTTVTVKQDENSLMNQQQRESFDGSGERQNRQQRENANPKWIQEEGNISFLNQLKFGLLDQRLG